MWTVRGRTSLWTVPVALAFGALAFIAAREVLREMALRRATSLMEAGRWTESARALAPLKGVRGGAAQAARMNLALALYHGRRYDEAARLLSGGGWAGSRVLAVRTAFGTGNCLYHLGDAAGAAAAYRRTLGRADAELERRLAPGGKSRSTAKATRTIREVRRRAAHNLAVVEHALVASEASAAHDETREAAAAGGEPDDTVPPEGRSGAGTTPADVFATARGGTGEDSSEATALIQDVLGRDSGPVLPRPHGPQDAAQGARARDW